MNRRREGVPPPGRRATGRLLLERVWHSPTATTWAALVVQGLGALAVLPLVLRHFAEPETAFWLLLLTLSALQAVFRFGFGPTFSRLIAYASGGRVIEDMLDTTALAPIPGTEPAWPEIARISSTMRRVFAALGAITLVVLGGGGTVFLLRPAQLVADPGPAWLAWAIVLASTSLQVSGAHFETLLQGMNQIVVAARWQALFGLGSLLSMVTVLLWRPSLLLLVFVHQAWLLAGIWRSRRLCHHLLDAGRRDMFTRGWDRAVFAIAWPSAWRSGVGHLASTGTTQFLGVLYAQAASAAGSASFLLGLRLLMMLEQFANAPFYSRIPRLNSLRGSGQLPELQQMAARGMRLTYWTFFVGVAALTCGGPAALGWVGSQAAFPGFPLWHVLAIAFFVQRFGGTHIQLHSTTNRIIWHWANGAGGAVTVTLAAILIPLAGFDAIALAMLGGNLVYAAIAARFSYGSLGMPAWRFELRVGIPPALAVLLVTWADVGLHLGNRLYSFLKDFAD